MREYSYGIIPLHQSQGKWEVLLIQHCAGHWAFPKGHAEGKETPKQAAERELKEETALTVSRYLSEKPLMESYAFFVQKKKIYKTVYYFLAQVEGEVIIQEAEVFASQWLPIDQAINHITFKEGKNLCLKVKRLLEEMLAKES